MSFFSSRKAVLSLRNWYGSLLHDIKNLGSTLWRSHSLQLVLLLSILPWIASGIVRKNWNPGIGWAEIAGIVGVYWFFSRDRSPSPPGVRQPIRESVIVLLFVSVWVAYRILQYSTGFAFPSITGDPCGNLGDTIVTKMIEMTLLPILVFLLLRYSIPQLGLGWPTWVWIPAAIPLLVLIGWGLTHQTAAGLATRTGCYYLGAGLPEEVLFRALLIPRFIAVTRRAEWGVLLSGFVFGATHLPIDLHGAGIANWGVALESAFTYQMSIGLALGYAFYRTRNIWPLTFIHALIDSAPIA